MGPEQSAELFSPLDTDSAEAPRWIPALRRFEL